MVTLSRIFALKKSRNRLCCLISSRLNHASKSASNSTDFFIFSESSQLNSLAFPINEKSNQINHIKNQSEKRNAELLENFLPQPSNVFKTWIRWMISFLFYFSKLKREKRREDLEDKKEVEENDEIHTTRS